MTAPRLSVVINTYSKGATLEKTLEALERQEGVAPESFEVVVRDDGSTDDTPTRLAAAAARWRGRLRWSRGENAGVSVARNEAIRTTHGDLVLILGDDIVGTPSLLHEHLAGHEGPPAGPKAIVGRVGWPPDLDADPFFHWLDNGGPQFTFWRIGEGAEIGPSHFYTCNVSLPRALALAHPFDPGITYGFEDVELGHRLRRAGVRLIYNPRAFGFHHHPRPLPEFRARQFKVGLSLRAALRDHQELADVLRRPTFPPRRRAKLLLRALAYPIARLAGARRLQQAYWRATLDYAMYRGYQEAIARETASAKRGAGRRRSG
jgi:glycosyltransferase involved in cell wall biosynthesis